MRTWHALRSAARHRARLVDPGRNELSKEFASVGKKVLDLPLKTGGSLVVTSHWASEWLPPHGSVSGSFQEWRVLRFRPEEGSNDLLQSITKVCVAPDRTPRARLQPQVLPLAYTKSLASVTLATLSLIGAPVLPGATLADSEELRILCVGLGGGSLPSFFVQSLPHCKVDVVEIEESVLRASTDAMGFSPCDRIGIAIEDGIDFALRATAEGRSYHAVLIDAYDASGDVPSAFWQPHEGLARALARGLLPNVGLVAGNFLPHMDITIALRTWRDALQLSGQGLAFSVEDTCVGNQIAVHAVGKSGVATCNAELEEKLRLQADAMAAVLPTCPFDMAELAVHGLQIR